MFHNPFRIRIRRALTLTLFLFIVGSLRSSSFPLQLMAASSKAPTAQNGEILVESGYLPDPNGFQFENYGKQFPEGDLTIQELQELFGNEQICSRMDGSTCVPNPEAQLFKRMMNKYMQSGHCVGFTVMGFRLWDQQFDASEFSTQAQLTYDIPQEVSIMRQIAANYTLQFVPEVIEQTVSGTPVEVVNALLAAESTEVEIGIANRTGAAHSLMAFGLADMGNDIIHILVYDNNHPGLELFVEVDMARNSWRYSMAAMNPEEDTEVWEGDADSKTLLYIPLSAYNVTPRTWPLSQEQKENRGRSTIVSLTGDGDFLAQDSRGRANGVWAGVYFNNIPGGKTIPARGSLSGKGAYVALPSEGELSVLAGNSNFSQDEPGILQVLTPDFSVALEGLALQRNSQESLFFSETERMIKYTAGSDQKTTIKVAIDNPNPDEESPETLFVIGNIDYTPSSGLTITDNSQRSLAIESEDVADDKVTLIVGRVDSSGQSVFATNDLSLRPGGSVNLIFDSQAAGQPLEVDIDPEGDGSFETISLENEFPQAVLEDARSAEDIIILMDESAAYLGPADINNLMDELGNVPLDGDDFGRLIFSFDEFGLDDREIIRLIQLTGLSPEEIAEFIFELRLDEDELIGFVQSIGLTNAVYEDVLTWLAELEEVHQLLVEIDFIDPTPGQEAEVILPYFTDSNLSLRQQGNLLERILSQQTVNIEQAEQIIFDLNLTSGDEALIREDLLLPATPDETPAAEPTLAARQTPTFTPDADSELDDTPTPTPTLTPTSVPVVSSCQIVSSSLNVRPGPGIEYNPPVTSLPASQALIPVARNPQSTWVQIEAGNVVGWVSASAQFISCTFDIGTLPIGEIPPTPTPAPTPTATPTIISSGDGESTGSESPGSESVSEPEPSTPDEVTAAGAQSSDIELRTTRQEIKQCECTEIFWRAEGVQAVYFQNEGQAGVSSQQVCPQATETYTLRVINTDGTEEVRQLTIDVIPDATCVEPTPTPRPQRRDENRNNDNNNRDNNDNEEAEEEPTATPSDVRGGVEDSSSGSPFESPLDTP
ncbi:MAG: hypothetical protein AAF702_31835 [Chloroflexota bacterium]